jgi:hypothetical protein
MNTDDMIRSVEVLDKDPKKALKIARKALKTAAMNYLLALEDDETPSDLHVDLAIDALKRAALFWAQTKSIVKSAVKKV